MDIDKLYDFFDNHYDDYPEIKYLLSSISDWPIEFNRLEDYVESYMEFLCVRSFKDLKHIEDLLKKINPKEHIWELESLSGFKFFLIEIGFDLKNYLKKINLIDIE